MDRKCGGSPGTSWQAESVTHPVLQLNSSSSAPHPQPETLRSVVTTMSQLLPAADMTLVTRVLVVCFPENLTLWWMLFWLPGWGLAIFQALVETPTLPAPSPYSTVRPSAEPPEISSTLQCPSWHRPQDAAALQWGSFLCCDLSPGMT